MIIAIPAKSSLFAITLCLSPYPPEEHIRPTASTITVLCTEVSLIQVNSNETAFK